MSEEQRAQKFVERHFPITAAFLAAEPGEGEPPVFGPTGVQNAHDDQPEPYVVVRVAYRLSRFELFAALADGYATTNTGADPDSMTVQQIRSDVEACLCLASWRDMEDLVERVARQIEAGEHPEQMQAMKRAMDRAFPLRPAAARAPEFAAEFPHVAAHLARERGATTAVTTVQTLDAGPVTFTEPFWCTGLHPDGGYRADLAHQGEEIALVVETPCHGEVRMLSASLYQGPFSELETTDIVAAVEFGEDGTESHSLGSQALAEVADGMVAFAVSELHGLIERLQLLRGES